MPLSSKLIIQQLLGPQLKMIINTSVLDEVNQIFQNYLHSQWMLDAASFSDVCYKRTDGVVPLQIPLAFTFAHCYS